jgi:hypothetical protein
MGGVSRWVSKNGLSAWEGPLEGPVCSQSWSVGGDAGCVGGQFLVPLVDNQGRSWGDHRLGCIQ